LQSACVEPLHRYEENSNIKYFIKCGKTLKCFNGHFDSVTIIETLKN